jgi:hypothetical protein
MRTWIMISAAVMIIVMGLYGSAVLVFDEDRLKGLLAMHVERDTGRRIDIRGDLRVRLFPGVRLEAEAIEISGPARSSGPSILEAEFLEMNLRLLPMIRGELEASQVRLRGARVNLQQSDPAGASGIEELLDPLQPAEEGARWLDGPIQVDDVLVNLSDSMGVRQEQFSVDRIELEGFAVGEPLQFRFRGNVGQPALFDWLEIDGLMVPQADGNFRLANMQMTGSLEEGHFALELLGNLDVHPGPPLAVSLDAGQLQINDHQFRAEIDYTAFDQPYVNLDLSSDFIDMNVAALPALLAGHLGARSGSSVVAGLQAMDFDLDVSVSQVAQAGLILNDLELQAQARDRRLTVDRLVADVPGGFLSALAVVDMAPAGWSSELGFRIDADDFADLARAIPMPLAPGGSGSLSLALVLATGSTGLVVNGEGAVELWNGSWRVLETMTPGVLPRQGSAAFEFLSSPIEVQSGRILLPEFQYVSSEIVGQGELALTWPLGEVEGDLDLSHEDQLVRVQVSGSLAEPRLEWRRANRPVGAER